MSSQIEGFMLNGERVTAHQQEYLDVAPRVLCLQLNRMTYSDKKMVKH